MLHSLTTRNKQPLQSWQNEINRLFDQFSKELSFDTRDLENFEPKVELKERGKQYVIRAEIPGMDEKDLQITLRDNCLIIEGERKKEEEKEDKGSYRSEFSYGSFYRALPLDEEVNENDVNASYKNGILTVKLTKSGHGKHGEKRIPISLS